jgi:hypothetical protein
LGLLARRLAATSNPVEAARLKERQAIPIETREFSGSKRGRSGAEIKWLDGEPEVPEGP